MGPWIEREIAPDAIEFSTHYVGRSVDPLVEVARALRDSVSVPIWMKISPNFPDIETLARSVSPIVDSFVAINSYGPVIDFDVETGAPVLGFGLRPGLDVGTAHSAHRPAGGVPAYYDSGQAGDRRRRNRKGVDAIKFFMVGASAVQMCSAAIKSGHQVYGKVAGEMDAWLEKHGYASVAEIKGLYKTRLRERRACARRTRHVGR